MESIIHEGSPLAAYLEGACVRAGFLVSSRSMGIPRLLHRLLTLRTGDGKGGPEPASPDETHNGQLSVQVLSFAPRGLSTFQSQIRGRLPQPLRINTQLDGPVARIHSACSV